MEHCRRNRWNHTREFRFTVLTLAKVEYLSSLFALLALLDVVAQY